jgi:hypothetical protein
MSSNFVHQLLLPITALGSSRRSLATSTNSEMTSERGVKSLNLKSHLKQAKDPRKSKIFKALQARNEVEVKNAIGKCRSRVFKLMLQQRKLINEDSTSTIYPTHDYYPIDLNSLLSVNEPDLGGIRWSTSPFCYSCRNR